MINTTVKMLMEQIFKKFFRSYTQIDIYDGRISETGLVDWVQIDRISALIYFTSYGTEKQRAAAHKYDSLIADWYIEIPPSPADVSKVKLCIYLIESPEKPIINQENQEVDAGE